jgi:DNA-binding transcriptional ArsR family regulator
MEVQPMLDELLGSKSRARIIAALMLAPEGCLHLRALVRAGGGSVSSAQREVERLEGMGLVEVATDERGRKQVTLVADHPFVTPLGGLVAADPRAQYEARVASVPNMDPEVAEVLGDWVDAIVTNFDPIQIVLFGSRARGTADLDSDVDLLVVLPEVENDHRVAVDILGAIGRRTRAVDVIPTDPQRIEAAKTMMASVVRNAVEEGVLVYDSAQGSQSMDEMGRGRDRRRKDGGKRRRDCTTHSVCDGATSR